VRSGPLASATMRPASNRLTISCTVAPVTRWSSASTWMSGRKASEFVLAQRPLPALWRLSGDIRYFDNPDQATGIGVLDYMTTVSTGIPEGMPGMLNGRLHRAPEAADPRRHAGAGKITPSVDALFRDASTPTPASARRSGSSRC
jgi:hypothetical protein